MIAPIVCADILAGVAPIVCADILAGVAPIDIARTRRTAAR
jgi:hypothetical protein